MPDEARVLKASFQELSSLPQITTNPPSFVPLQVGESRGSRGRVAAGTALLQLRKQPPYSLGESDVWDVGDISLPHQFSLSASGSALMVAGRDTSASCPGLVSKELSARGADRALGWDPGAPGSPTAYTVHAGASPCGCFSSSTDGQIPVGNTLVQFSATFTPAWAPLV